MRKFEKVLPLTSLSPLSLPFSLFPIYLPRISMIRITQTMQRIQLKEC